MRDYWSLDWFYHCVHFAKKKGRKVVFSTSVFKDAGSTIIISTVLTSIYFINIIDVLNRLYVYVCMYCDFLHSDFSIFVYAYHLILAFLFYFAFVYLCTLN